MIWFLYNTPNLKNCGIKPQSYFFPLLKTMTWNGNNPVIRKVKRTYNKGVKVAKQAMEKYESMMKRLPELGKWFIEISPQAV